MVLLGSRDFRATGDLRLCAMPWIKVRLPEDILALVDAKAEKDFCSRSAAMCSIIKSNGTKDVIDDTNRNQSVSNMTEPVQETITKTTTRQTVAKRSTTAKSIKIQEAFPGMGIALIPEEEKKEDTEEEARLAPLDISYRIAEHMSRKFGVKVRGTGKVLRRKLQARLNDGFVEQDFHDVIEKKGDEWLHDDMMAKYLRAETLFGSKFEGYVAQPKVKPKADVPDDPRGAFWYD